jgi:hypothetical protein
MAGSWHILDVSHPEPFTPITIMASYSVRHDFNIPVFKKFHLENLFKQIQLKIKRIWRGGAGDQLPKLSSSIKAGILWWTD